MKKKQGKYDLVKGQALIVGVDIGKAKHWAAFRGGEGVEKTMSFSNDLEGFEKLRKEIVRLKEKTGAERVVVGMEPTGSYWQSLAYWWEDQGGTQVLVNPMNTKKAKEMEDNSPLKSDQKDARVIAGLVAEGKYLNSHLPRGEFATLRELMNQRAVCREQEGRLRNQLQQQVGRVFPELEGILRPTSKTWLEYLATNADPRGVAGMTVEKLGRDLQTWSRGRFGEKEAKAIIEALNKSVGVREGVEAIARGIVRTVERIRRVAEEQEEVEAEIRECSKKVPSAKWIKSVPELGDMLTAGILGHTGDLRGYAHADQVIKMAGLNLYELSSGQRKGAVRITKRGRSQLRKVLYMAALRTSRKGGSMRSYYEQLTGRGVPKLAGLVAVMRKLLRICWALAKKEEEFDAAKLVRAA